MLPDLAPITTSSNCLGGSGHGFLSLGGFFDCSISHFYLQDFKWISIDVVPYSLPLTRHLSNLPNVANNSLGSLDHSAAGRTVLGAPRGGSAAPTSHSLGVRRAARIGHSMRFVAASQMHGQTVFQEGPAAVGASLERLLVVVLEGLLVVGLHVIGGDLPRKHVVEVLGRLR